MLQQIEDDLLLDDECPIDIIITEKKKHLEKPKYEHYIDEDPLNWEMEYYYDEFDSDDEMNYI